MVQPDVGGEDEFVRGYRGFMVYGVRFGVGGSQNVGLRA